MATDQTEMMRQLQVHGPETRALYQASRDINRKLISQEEVFLRVSSLLSSQQKRTDAWRKETQRRNQNAISEMSIQQQNQRQLSQEVLNTAGMYQTVQASIDQQRIQPTDRSTSSTLELNVGGEGTSSTLGQDQRGEGMAKRDTVDTNAERVTSHTHPGNIRSSANNNR